MTVSKMVNDFANITGQEGTKKLYTTLIEEEYNEWCAEIGQDPAAEIKELADLVYVIYGYARVKDTTFVPSAEQLAGWLDIQYVMEQWFEEHGCGSKAREYRMIEKALGIIYNYADNNGWDLPEAIRRVHQNNLGRCIQPDGTIQRRVDGKIIKNKDYPPVVLGDLV